MPLPFILAGVALVAAGYGVKKKGLMRLMPIVKLINLLKRQRI